MSKRQVYNHLYTGPIASGIPALVKGLGQHSEEAAEGIMTTDTKLKEIAVSFTAGGRECKIGGICKGSGMIPEGLYLLTSVAIAASCLKLSRKRVLVQDMNCIETLAHVDVLCVDKTGTITEPTMEVTDVYPLNSERFSYDDIEKILAAFYHGEEPDNETARAMGQQFAGETTWRAVKRMAFSSSTKWSGADFGENGRYVVGAPEFIMGDRYDSIRSEAEPWSERGCRVLLLAAYDNLGKGASGAAIECMNLVTGAEKTLGLEL